MFTLATSILAPAGLRAAILLCAQLAAAAAGAPTQGDVPRLVLERVELPQSDVRVERGIFTVWENRATRRGRTLELEVAVLRSTGANPEPDPVFMFAGGPGVAVLGGLARFARAQDILAQRDIVLMNQRGTGARTRLDCSVSGSSDDPQGYLEQPFADSAGFAACLEELAAP